MRRLGNIMDKGLKETFFGQYILRMANNGNNFTIYTSTKY